MQFVCGEEKRSICIGCVANCGASSCQPGVLPSADALVCACTERTVMKTCANCPVGGTQLGGSLNVTWIMPVADVSFMELPPPQLTARNTATDTTAKKPNPKRILERRKRAELRMSASLTRFTCQVKVY